MTETLGNPGPETRAGSSSDPASAGREVSQAPSLTLSLTLMPMPTSHAPSVLSTTLLWYCRASNAGVCRAHPHSLPHTRLLHCSWYSPDPVRLSGRGACRCGPRNGQKPLARNISWRPFLYPCPFPAGLCCVFPLLSSLDSPSHACCVCVLFLISTQSAGLLSLSFNQLRLSLSTSLVATVLRLLNIL